MSKQYEHDWDEEDWGNVEVPNTTLKRLEERNMYLSRQLVTVVGKYESLKARMKQIAYLVKDDE